MSYVDSKGNIDWDKVREINADKAEAAPKAAPKANKKK
jgi:hypothetical protein